jgi:hypothetical protein
MRIALLGKSWYNSTNEENKPHEVMERSSRLMAAARKYSIASLNSLAVAMLDTGGSS